jgi:hypothetical protein
MPPKEENEIDDTQSGDGSELSDVLSGDETSFVTEQKKPMDRTTVLVFGVLLLGAAGYYMMYARTGPQAATAATAESEQADQTINQFLSSGEQHAREMRKLRETTDKVVAQFQGAAPTQVPVAELQANPFKYSQENDEASNAAAAQKKREEERVAAVAAAQTLQLQTILSGAKKTCMINNQMYTEGQTVSGFTVEVINADGVVVKSGSYRFKLKMQR